MPRLVHLNGPPGVGKSTLSQRYVDEHPGVLNLDIDQVVPLIGGWQHDFFATLPAARRIAIAMAAAHLEAGHDVVLPQLVTDLGEAQRFEDAAAGSGATYVELALAAAPAEQVRRFRAKDDGSSVHRQIARAIDAEGGDALLERIRQHVEEYVAQRPRARSLVIDGLDVEATYDLLLAALAD